jgi:microcystin-dependent protein
MGDVLSIDVQPGYEFQAGETLTREKLNQLGRPAVTVHGAVGSSALADDAVSVDKLQDRVLEATDKGRAKMADGFVQTAELFDQAVTTGKIAAGAVTKDKLASDVTGLFLPAGTVMAFAGATAPAGWLECDGSLRNVADFPALGAVLGGMWGGDGTTTFKLPDLRGQFLRGLQTSTGVDAGRTRSNTPQADMLKDHTHGGGNYYKRAGTTSGSGTWVVTTTTADTLDVLAPVAQVSSPNGGGTETRPTNVAMMYIIRT